MRRHDLIGAKKTKGTIYIDESQFHKRETADGGIISNRPLKGKVKSIKGNTVSWNQLLTNNNFESTTRWQTTGGTITTSNNELLFVPNATPTQQHSERVIQNIKTVGHTYYVQFDINPPRNTDVLVTIKVGTSKKSVISNTWNSIAYVIKQTEGYSDMAIYVDCLKQNVEGDIVKLRNVNLVDLTLIYGAGSEPSTPEQFEADYKKWFGKDLTYEPYDAGSLRSVTMEGFKSVGFNLLNLGGRTTPINVYSASTTAKQFDESQYYLQFAYNGYCGRGTRTVVVSADSIYCSSSEGIYGVGFPIKCTPNTRYYIKSQHSAIGFFDSDGLYLNKFFMYPNGSFVTPDNCEWMVVVLCRVSGDNITEVNPIVNLDSSLNGIYITGINPSDVSYDVTTMQGRLNGEGELVTPFADGLKSAGTVHDEIVNDNGVLKGIKRIGSVDLGTLNWSGPSIILNMPTINVTLNGKKVGNIMKIEGYNTVGTGPASAAYGRDKSFLGNPTTANIYIVDSAIDGMTQTQIKEYLSGVILYYELATPEEYVMEADALEYRCTRGGSEEVVGSVVSPTLEIEYEH